MEVSGNTRDQMGLPLLIGSSINLYCCTGFMELQDNLMVEFSPVV